MRAAPLCWAALLLFALASCVGAKAEITLNASGGGRLALEYRVSRQFEAIGALDGNTRWPSVPVGKADFERSLERLEGLKLLSFSSKEEGPDLVTRALIGFSRLEDILPLLDYSEEGARLSREGDKQVLRLRLGSPAPQDPIDPQLLALAEEVSRPYHIAVSLVSPSAVEFRAGGAGEDLRIEQNGKTAGFSVPLSYFFLPGRTLEAEFLF
jgi:hypothetical protein